MREFDEFEKDIIRAFVNGSTAIYNVSGYAKEIFGDKIRIVIEQKEVQVFQIKKEGLKWNKDKRYITSFIKLLYFIGLLIELEREGLIIISPNLNNSFIPLYGAVNVDYEPYAIDQFYQTKINYYLSSNVLARYSLIDLVNKDFKTVDQLRFEKQLYEARKQTQYSRIALYVALGALTLSFITLIVTLICK